MKQLNDSMLDALSEQARQSPRFRANHNLHEQLSDPIQRLAIAMEPDTLVAPHRHPHTWEMLFALRGRFIVLVFDDVGKVLARIVLSEGCSVAEIPIGAWHGVLSLDAGGIIFEVKHGPYQPIPACDAASWARGQDAATINAWYARASVGSVFPA
ncbi:MAG: WbuC family cupin fold metalloprotein [Nitrosomonadales bacterium]|nr:WbuC family cupin fold metalloprotein [Nitrosomonadales bacterium]